MDVPTADVCPTHPYDGIQFRHGHLLGPLNGGRHLLLVLSKQTLVLVLYEMPCNILYT